MKVQIRTLKQEKYQIEIAPTETIGKLKEIIQEQHKFDKAWQILIFSGKILADDKTIESYKFEEKDFLVLMVKKPDDKGANAAAKPAATATPSRPEQPKPEPEKVPDQPKPTESSTPAPKPAEPAPNATGTATPSSGGELVMGEEYNATVDRICDMGFPRDQVVLALRVAFHNPDRAVEYLMTGIPNIPVAAQPQPTGGPGVPRPAMSHAPAPSVAAGTGTGAAGAGAGAGIFDELRNHPQFPALCRLAQEGGEPALKQILTYFAQTNPQLIQLISQHQDDFIQLLNTPLTDIPGGGGGGGGMGGALGGGGGGAAGPVPGMPGVIRVQITPEDEEVINNLCLMGNFDRSRVIEAYFLFEKDSTAAANYLLNYGAQDEEFDIGTGGFGDYEEDDEDDVDDQ